MSLEPVRHVASLPMYGIAELRAATETWWAGVARHLEECGIAGVPKMLTWPRDVYRHWRSPDLLFSQTCGHPLVNLIAGDVRLVATPHYGAPGCDGSRYASHVLVRADAAAESIDGLRGGRLAVNGPDSYSGFHVWTRLLPSGETRESYFGRIIETGSHRAAIRGVRTAEADVCAVDCVTHALLSDRAPDEVEGTRILATSPPVPALPFVTGAATSTDDATRLREGLFAALADPSLAEVRAALRLTGASVPTEADYLQAFKNRMPGSEP